MQIKEYGTDGTEGNYLNISYNDNNTTILTDRKGRSETHTFNNKGETVSVRVCQEKCVSLFMKVEI